MSATAKASKPSPTKGKQGQKAQNTKKGQKAKSVEPIESVENVETVESNDNPKTESKENNMDSNAMKQKLTEALRNEGYSDEDMKIADFIVQAIDPRTGDGQAALAVWPDGAAKKSLGLTQSRAWRAIRAMLSETLYPAETVAVREERKAREAKAEEARVKREKGERKPRRSWSDEERAEAIARKALGRDFRRANSLREQGRVPMALNADFEKWSKENYEDYYKRALALQKESVS